MLKHILAMIVLLHGLIHLMGFAKAFHYGDLKQLTIPISKPAGVLWLATAILFITSSVLLLLKKEYWWLIAIAAVILSQAVIIRSWKDARFGTIINILVLAAAVLSRGSSRFENSWRQDAHTYLHRSNPLATEILSGKDILHLPPPVQRYLQYARVVDKPRVNNMYVVMDVQMREKGKSFFHAISKQYNFFDEPTRLFFMKADMYGITVPGYHHYINGNAVMDIRFAGLFTIVKNDGEVMDRAETVTLFNDMCLMAPATLIDKRIRWETIDSHSVKAFFTNHKITVSATLYFNEEGQLINFISHDRTEVNTMNNFPFSTPVRSYKNINGFNLFAEGDAVWEYPDGPFVYGRFKLKDIKYNVSQ